MTFEFRTVDCDEDGDPINSGTLTASNAHHAMTVVADYLRECGTLHDGETELWVNLYAVRPVPQGVWPVIGRRWRVKVTA